MNLNRGHNNIDNHYIDKYDKIVDRAYNEIKSVRNVYYWLSGMITIIIVTGIGVGGFLFYNNIREQKAEMRTEIDRIKSEEQRRINLLEEELKLNLSKIIYDVEKEVRERVDAEFDKDNIKEIVANTATDKVKNYSDKIIDESFKSDILPQITTIHNNIASLNSSIMQTQKLNLLQINNTKEELQKVLKTYQNSLDSLRISATFLNLVLSAQNDDRKAWNQLKKLGDDNKYIYRKEATNAYDTIKDSYSNPTSDISAIIDLSALPEILDPKNSIDNVKKMYNELLTSYSEVSWSYRRSLIKYVYDNKTFSEFDKMQFLIDVLNKDTSLRVASYAGRLFAEHYNIDIKALGVDYLNNFWKNKKGK